ncbi:hypothetical protein B0H19DRAFT_1068261 [Mycena capillaripes]|nr:hypothetical protein B0H19DRAFT_1068261 [Mycena capillaripes]
MSTATCFLILATRPTSPPLPFASLVLMSKKSVEGESAVAAMKKPRRHANSMQTDLLGSMHAKQESAPISPPVEAQIQRNQDRPLGELRPSTVLQAHFFLLASGNETKGNVRRFQSVFPMVRCVDIGAAVDLYLKLAQTEAIRDVVTMENTEIRALVFLLGRQEYQDPELPQDFGPMNDECPDCKRVLRSSTSQTSSFGICCNNGKGIFSVAKTRVTASIYIRKDMVWPGQKWHLWEREARAPRLTVEMLRRCLDDVRNLPTPPGISRHHNTKHQVLQDLQTISESSPRRCRVPNQGTITDNDSVLIERPKFPREPSAAKSVDLLGSMHANRERAQLAAQSDMDINGVPYTFLVMFRAQPGLDTRAWAWLEQAWA